MSYGEKASMKIQDLQNECFGQPGSETRKGPPGGQGLLLRQLAPQGEDRLEAGDSRSQVLHVPSHLLYSSLDGVGSVMVGELVQMGGGRDNKDLVLLLLHHRLLLSGRLHAVPQRSSRWLGYPCFSG